MPAPNEITPARLLRLIGTPGAPVIVDISTDPDFADDPFLIPGAFRHPHDDMDGLITRLNGRASIIVCQKGMKLSQGVSAWLRSEGLVSEYLQNGNLGWRDQDGAPRLPACAVPAPVRANTLWVTRHRPKIDRIACPWFIRRFVDPDARFLFVAPSEVDGVADRFCATPFDTKGGSWSHEGPNCTFDKMLSVFGLHTEPLDRMATVIRAADTNTHANSPEAAGLLAISVGLSRQYRDDQEQLDAGMAIYDALYRWARDGQNETHDWPGGGAK